MKFPKTGILHPCIIPAQYHWASSLHRKLFSRIPVCSITAHLQYAFAIIFVTANFTAAAQTNIVPVFKGALSANRTKTHNNIVKNIIIKNLGLPLTDTTEENWADAFFAMEVLQYKQPWVLQKVKSAFNGIEKRSVSFQRALLELVFTNYKNEYAANAALLLENSDNAKVFAMCAEYLLQCSQKQYYLKKIYSNLSYKSKTFKTDSISNNIISAFISPISESENIAAKLYRSIYIHSILKSSFIEGVSILYSIQRKNRNYPGIAIVRDSAGNFITDSSGNIFSVPQLARSITNLPGYLTNGNTPQGIFRITGFAVSKSDAIGPTENIQLMMPLETTPQFFLKDSSITDTVWTKELYERLLPDVLKKYHPLFGTYYASAIGRTEIIAHGTTVDPAYYKGQPYYPHTPTQGCLSTIEVWSAAHGKRTTSNQQKLVDAVKKAGAANGYCIVIEIDDLQKPVTLTDILPNIKTTKQ